jgi:hypothetical protein
MQKKKGKSNNFKYSPGGNMCEDLMNEIFYNGLLTKAMSFIITGVNIGLKQIVVWQVAKWGCNTESIQMIYTTSGVFITNFLNTAFLLMLANANLADQKIPILDYFLSTGPDPDFNLRWFKSVGETLV